MGIDAPKTIGLKKGDEGGEVIKLQNYLREFGYIQPDHASDLAEIDLERSIQRPQTGKFDDNTENALLLFQEFYKLPTTGILDEKTIQLIMLPRCGFPDIIKGKQFDYIDTGTRWNDISQGLTYDFREGNASPPFPLDREKRAIAYAMEQWSSVIPCEFADVHDAPDSTRRHIKISWHSGAHGDILHQVFDAFDAVGGILAHASNPEDDLIHFDAAEAWFEGDSAPTGIDLSAVALHELGHKLGLGHSRDSSAVMFPFNGNIRQLQPDDVIGIRSIYGTRPGWGSNVNAHWESLGGILTSGPGVSSWDENRLDVFVISSDNALWHKWYDGNSDRWGSNVNAHWESLGKPPGINLTSNPAAVSWRLIAVSSSINRERRIDVFVRGSDNALWHKWYDGNSDRWGSNVNAHWESLGGILTSGPGVSSWWKDRLDVFVRGGDNILWHKTHRHGGGWLYYEPLGGGILGGRIDSDPAAVSWGNRRIDVFVRGSDNTLWHKWYAG
jgi:hypothetical protein